MHLRSEVSVDAHGGMKPKQDLNIDVVVDLECPRLEPVADVFAGIHDDGLPHRHPKSLQSKPQVFDS